MNQTMCFLMFVPFINGIKKNLHSNSAVRRKAQISGSDSAKVDEVAGLNQTMCFLILVLFIIEVKKKLAQ